MSLLTLASLIIMLDWELGSVVIWVSLGKKKPFPITLFRKEGEWTADVHAENLSQSERIAVESCIKERTAELHEMWNTHLYTRLSWDVHAIGRKKKR